jgi:hypothetical protein
MAKKTPFLGELLYYKVSIVINGAPLQAMI